MNEPSVVKSDEVKGGSGPPSQAGRTRRKNAYQLRCGDFEQVATQWDKWISQLGRVHFYQHPDWYRALFDASLAPPDSYLFVTLSDGPDLIGLFPLRRHTRWTLGMKIHSLGFCVHPHMVLADCLIDDSRQCTQLVSFLVDWLYEASPMAWDVLTLERVPQRSSFYRLLSKDNACRVVVDMTGSSAHLSTVSEDEALGPVSGSFRRNLRRLAKRAEEVAPLRYEVYDTLPDLEPAFTRFLEVEASGWKGACGTGTAIAQDEALAGFYHGIMRRFSGRGQCVINELTHGDKVVASQFGLLVGGTYSILKIGYCEEHAWFAPGNLVMERTIRWCCERPDIQELSFVTCPSWGHLWKPQQESVTRIQIFSPSLKGRLLYQGLLAKRWYNRGKN
jgi:CelD/BcsL family acetyltransferase involved in cellulose biosynthesis